MAILLGNTDAGSVFHHYMRDLMNESISPGLGHRLAARRLQLKLTQREVERKARIARTALSRLERDDCPLVPRVSTIERIAKVLEIDYLRLINPDKQLDAYPVPCATRLADGDVVGPVGARIAVHRNGAAKRRRRVKKAA